MQMNQTIYTQLQITPNELINAICDELEKRLEKQKPKKQEASESFDKIPISEIFDRKIISKPTFYRKVKEGIIVLHKLGGRSYVDRYQFNEAFHSVKIHNNK